jgi:gamma-glutamylcyclotransferase (GGCT)/AIG2-like uncharacterized protein YtfP
LGNATFIAATWTDPFFTLVDMGGFPALVEGGTTAVLGEIYDIAPENLIELDRYEDTPKLYQRVARTIAGHEVQVYLMPARCAEGRPQLLNGDWCATRA